MSNGASKPAFPVTVRREDAEPLTYTGLTKREYFAAMAMQGLLASDTPEWYNHCFESDAKWAAEAADALIAELAK